MLTWSCLDKFTLNAAGFAFFSPKPMQRCLSCEWSTHSLKIFRDVVKVSVLQLLIFSAAPYAELQLDLDVIENLEGAQNRVQLLFVRFRQQQLL